MSTVRQADHYPHGINTIMDMVHQKMIRAKSLLETQERSGVSEAKFESLEDTLKDAINYLSFAVSWLRGAMDGQDPNRDAFNRLKVHYDVGTSKVGFFADAKTVSEK